MKMSRVLIIVWALSAGLTAVQAQDRPWAGSFDGSFTFDGETAAGTMTFVLRQEGANLRGRLGHEFADGGCVRVSELEGTLQDGLLYTDAQALDYTYLQTTVIAALYEEGEQAYLYGVFIGRACAGYEVAGQFLLRKLEASNPPNIGGPYVGGLWSPTAEVRTRLFWFARRMERDVTIDRLTLQLPDMPPVGGQGQARVNPEGDRLEPASLTLDTPFGPLTLRLRDTSVSSNGDIIFGVLEWPLPTASLARPPLPNLLVRREYVH